MRRILPEVHPARAVQALGRSAARRLRKLRAVQQRDQLFLDAQRAVVREIHARFAERAERGEKGIASAVEGLDTMWSAVRQLQPGAGTVVETLAQGPDRKLGPHLRIFASESTAHLEDAIERVFGEDTARLLLPSKRLAVLVRIAIEGFLVELARAETAEDLVEIDQAYDDLRSLFARHILRDAGPAAERPSAPVPLPW